MRVWGEIGYDYRAEDHETMRDFSEHTALVRVNAASPIHAPWLATFQGGLGAALRRGEFGDEDTSVDDYTGDLVLRIFPLSRFPLELFAERTDARNDTDLSSVDLTLTRYGFQQRYTSEGGGAYRLRYERSDQDYGMGTEGTADEDSRVTGDFLQAAFDQTFGAHGISFDSDVSRVDSVDTDLVNETRYASVRHSYRPGAMLNAEDLLTYHRADIEDTTTDYSTEIVQLTSYGFWRPQTRRPLTVNATMRGVTRSAAGSDRADAGTSTIGANYEWNDNWTFSGSTGASGVQTTERTDMSTFQVASARFTSDPRSVLGASLTWLGQGDLSHNRDDQIGTIVGGGLQGGYNLSRNWPMSESSSTLLTLSQSVSQVTDSDDFSATTLLTSAAVGWNARGERRSSLLRVAISDSRTWPQGEDIRDVEGEFQIANLQLSIDHRLSINSSLVGNLTLQATRESRPQDADFQSDLNGEWRPTATADLSYLARALGGVPNLTFRSTLRFVSDAYVPVLDEPTLPQGRDDRRWENRLEYLIGRTQIRLVARLAELDDERQSLLLLQIRRFIGDI